MRNYVRYFAAVTLIIIAASLICLKVHGLNKVTKTIPAEVSALFKNVQIGSPQTYKDMTIYPIVAGNPKGEKMLLLDDSIKDNIIEITEKGSSGSVNSLDLQKNESKSPVFMMAGEIVKGAKQDRIIGHDIILDKDSKKYTISVYCVEQGRWVKHSEKFEPSGVVGTNALRSAVAQSKSQSAIWNEVATKNKSMGAVSDTSNYRASYETKAYKEEGAAYVSHFLSLAEKNPKMVGVIVKINDKVTNMDVFGDHDIFKGLWPKLLKAYSQDAVDESSIKSLPKTATPQEFMNALKNCNYNEMSNPGLGNEFSIKGDKVAGNVLTHSADIMHLALFADSSKGEPVTKYNDDQQINATQQRNYEQIPNIVRPPR